MFFILNLEGRRILVTGVAGFIGSNLSDVLLEKKASVIGIDNFFNGRMDNIKDSLQNQNFTFHKADIRDYDFLLEICKGIDIIFHEAAFTSVPQSVKMPISCNDVNVGGTLNILNAARVRDVEAIIFASSSSVYGDTPTLPKREDMSLIPISPYGVAKLACEKYLYAYYKIYGLNTIALRYFNVYGPRQKDSTYSGVIPIWLGRIYRNENPIVFGDGEQRRDFTYIKDVVDANLLAGVAKNISGEVFNIGASSPITVNKLAVIMKKVCGKEHLGVEYTDPRPGDIRDSFADIVKAKRILKFEPKFNIQTGLEAYIEWSRSRNYAL